MTFEPSKYQEAIYHEVEKGEGNIVVQAVAGSGKTTTLVECGNKIPQGKRSIFLAFNSAIAKEMNNRLPSNVEGRTLHSIGFGIIRDNTTVDIKVDNDKVFLALTKALDKAGYEGTKEQYSHKISMLKKIVGFIKAFNCDYTKFEEVNDIVLLQNIEYEIDDMDMDIIASVMNTGLSNLDTIDYDDMIYIPVKMGYKAKTFDWVFVDEVQDLNMVQLELVKIVCNGNTRIIAVGDRYQSIYAFRGADKNSMDNFKEHFKAKEMPLSICYRCPKSHIVLAKTIVPAIEPSETAEEGILKDLSMDEAVEKADNKDLIICRSNAPLLKMAFRLIRAKKKAVIRGRDISKGIINLVKKYKNVISVDDLAERITKSQRLQESKLRLIEDGKLSRGKKGAVETSIDVCETALVLLENCESIREVEGNIKKIFTEYGDGIICSSVHKAKGLEADRVFILNYSQMPSKRAETEQEIQQEMNIKYVAVTRAKHELYKLEDEE